MSMRGKWRLMCILDFFKMKTLLQLLLAQKLISSQCVLFKNNLLQSDTVPLMYGAPSEFCLIWIACLTYTYNLHIRLYLV